MKKFITIAALIAAGTAFANAETLTVSNPWYVSGCVGNYTEFQINLDSVSMCGTGSATQTSYTLPEGTYSISSLGLAQESASNFTNTNQWASGADTSLVVLDSENSIVAISSSTASLSQWQWYGNQSNKAFVSFSFDNLTVSTGETLNAVFVSSTEGLSVGSTLTDTSIITTGRFIGSTYDNKSGVANNASSFSPSFGIFTPCIQYTVTAIPEPSAFGLLAGVGALALVAARRRRAK